jgi:hypothetical protein
MRSALLACAGLVLAVGAASAPVDAAPLRPVVFTGEAGQLTTTSATLNGSIDPSNQPTSYYYQYGATVSYGAQTPLTLAGAGTQSVHVTADVAGLAVGTIYHYRLVGVNATGATDGADRTLTTKKVPLSLTLLAPGRGLFGMPFEVTGVVSGTGSAGKAVVLEANPFPYLAGFSSVAGPVQTDQSGSFSLRAPGLDQNTQLRVSTLEVPRVSSRVAVEFVEVRVTLHLHRTGRRGDVRFYGTVMPSEPGALVGLQLVRPRHHPLGVAMTLLTGAGSTGSRFSKVVRIPRAGLYRAFVYVASGAQVSNHSRAIRVG